MRPTHPLEALALAAVLIPTVGFTLACVPIGCGSEPLPTRVRSGEHGPREAELVGAGATADTGSERLQERCDDRPPTVALYRQEGADLVHLEDQVDFAYGGGCGGEGTLWLDVVADGLLSGPVEVGWSTWVDGFEPKEGVSTWELGCLAEGGLQHGRLSVDLPMEADGAAVTVDVVLVDAAGTEVSTTHTFVATVIDRD